MENKELFKMLSEEVRFDVVSTLSAYEKCHIEFYNGKYHATANCSISKSYQDDYKSFKNEFKAQEFFSDILWYHKAWQHFWTTKEASGEKVNHEEFEEWAETKINEAIENYLK